MKAQKLSLSLPLIVSILLSSTLSFAAKGLFPEGPETELTPGSLCAVADEFRYPEKIKYCRRDVESEEKREIIRKYDQVYGYHIGEMNRADFRFDHFFPLCAGGSNEESNLWPQHKSIYQITDELEPLICELMSEGQLAQVNAVEYIKEAKLNLEKAASITDSLRKRLHSKKR